MKLCSALALGNHQLATRLVHCPDPAKDGEHWAERVKEALPGEIGVMDDARVADRRVLYAAALKALTEQRDEQLFNRTLIQQIVFNLCPTRSIDKAHALAKPSGDTLHIILFSCEPKALENLNLDDLVPGCKLIQQDEQSIDYERADKARAERKLHFATEYYKIDGAEFSQKSLWQIVCARVAAKGV